MRENLYASAEGDIGRRIQSAAALLPKHWSSCSSVYPANVSCCSPIFDCIIYSLAADIGWEGTREGISLTLNLNLNLTQVEKTYFPPLPNPNHKWGYKSVRSRVFFMCLFIPIGSVGYFVVAFVFVFWLLVCFVVWFNLG